ncbi:MAG: esterase-like activity of phytase family protein [Azonexus sp.]
MFKRLALPILVSLVFIAPAQAGVTLIASGALNGTSDLSGLSGALENGVAANVLGGMGSGLAWAGGNTFLALPDRGPNASSYAGGGAIDNTTSYIDRFQTITLNLTQSQSAGSFSYALSTALNQTTLLYSPNALNYGSMVGLLSAVPVQNTAERNYFTGRSDNFAAGNSLAANNARLDPEGIRVANDGKSVYVSDEYGPYVRQFDRASGALIKTFALPANLAVNNLSSAGATEIAGNATGRVANKGMEGLAITPDGKTLVGFMQSALLQDGGDGAKANRIVTIDIATGATKQFAYNNVIGGKTYGSSEILALNSHQFLVLERDGKGLGDGSAAKVKQIWVVDLAGAQDVSGLSGEAALLAKAPSKKLFLDIKSALNSVGIADKDIPAKLEGMAFGEDITENGALFHTLYVANDNDFSDLAGANQFFVFKFSDTDLSTLSLGAFENQSISTVSEPGTYAMLLGALGLLAGFGRRKQKDA